MTRQERAKQFMPFDAMKGLSEALRERERRHAEKMKNILTDEEKAEADSARAIMKEEENRFDNYGEDQNS